ncbi:MAG TPA: sulfur transferase domain-containing protein [Vicinamibacterales bacterium]|nr:sulfur transferase domain-containing protein [Vicinamibacterales bacterium]
MRACLPIAVALMAVAPALAQQVTKENVPGVTNFARLETTVACGGATTAAAVPELKKMGFASIINLRVPTEQGANIEQEEAAAKEAGIKFYSIPFNTASPDPSVPETFLKTLKTPGNEPAYIHCASGNRAAAMWMIKRIAIDHWDTDRAATEAASLGLTNQALKQFATDYAQSHKQ